MHGHEKVIKVHDGMYGIVHRAKDNSGRRVVDVSEPAKEQNGNVMVPMQED